MDMLKVELTLDQANVVLLGLSKLPIEQGMDTFLQLRAQLEAQVNQQPQEEAPAE